MCKGVIQFFYHIYIKKKSILIFIMSSNQPSHPVVYGPAPKSKPKPKGTVLNFGELPKNHNQKPNKPEDDAKPKTVRVDVSNRIRNDRTRLGWTQKELAQKAQVQHNIITEYESGKANNNQGEIQKILKALDQGLRSLEKIEKK